jgi:Protein of unknown function (DUF4232)
MTGDKIVVRALYVLAILVLAALAYAVIRVHSPAGPGAEPTITVTATVTPAPSTTVAGQPCLTSSLRSAVVPDVIPGGTGDTYTLDLVLTNTGTVSCTLSGYPSVTFVGLNAGTQLGLPATKTGFPQQSGTTATLKIGESQAVQLSIDEFTVNGTRSGCDIEPADGFRIYPPGQDTSLFSPFRGLSGCSTKAFSVLQVGAFGHE